jgi:hypothetical protein
VALDFLVRTVAVVAEGLRGLKNNYKLKPLVGTYTPLREGKEAVQERGKCSNRTHLSASAQGREVVKELLPFSLKISNLQVSKVCERPTR